METTTPPSLLAELEAAIQDGSSEKRIDMLRRITDLFVDTAPRVTDEQAGVFDDVFEQLIKEIESKAVLELSDRMARSRTRRSGLIRRLANDNSIEISGPVLARSDRLDQDELLAIARTKSQAHLQAIAGRAELGEQVTDVLVERGDMTVARKVAANSGARFSEVLAAQPDRPRERRRRSRACGRAAARASARDVPQPAGARDRHGAQAPGRYRQPGDREGDQQDPGRGFAEGRKHDRHASATIARPSRS